MYCMHCGAEINDKAIVCVKCGGSCVQTPDDNSALRMVLPIGRSGLAILAGYLGLFAMTVVVAPFALLVGILALRDIRKHPEKHGRGRAWFGIVMGALFSLILMAFLTIALITKT